MADSRMPEKLRQRAGTQKPPAARCHSAEVSWSSSTAVDHRRLREIKTAQPCHRLGQVPAYLRQSSSMPITFRQRAVTQKPRAARCQHQTAKPCHRLGHVPAYLRRIQASPLNGSVTKLAGKEQEQVVRKPAVVPLDSIPAYWRTNSSSSAGEDRETKPVLKKHTENKETSCWTSEQNPVLAEIKMQLTALS
ncbi:hypothetical protein pipiens_008202 [Culex pipiens pipiens]|uniref:Uncharacterized protein n=1 Tax=Culex pipiens pipiens TaxID=38569 RepID=A0ABD1DIC7_CULPP